MTDARPIPTGKVRAPGGASMAFAVAMAGLLLPWAAMAQTARGDDTPVPSAPALSVHGPEASDLHTARFVVVLQERPVMIRVPAAPVARTFVPMPRPLPTLPIAGPVRWDTRKGPKCLPMRMIVGVRAATRDSIDVLTRERERMRLELERGCRALDFYAGFYMARSDDAALCRERDLLQARSGERCTVKHIRRLVAVPIED